MLSAKSHNSVLLDFDSLIDIRFGVILYLRNMYADYSKSSGIPKYINKEYLFQDLTLLLRRRVFDGEDTIRNCFAGQFRDSALEIESDILRKDLNTVLNLSTETTAVDLIKKFKTMADGAVKSCVFCIDDTKYKFALSKGYNNYTSIKKCKSISEVNLDNYARIILSDTKYIDEFNPEFKSICIMGYGENFINKMEYGSIDHGIIMKHNTNEFSIINPYKHITRTIG